MSFLDFLTRPRQQLENQPAIGGLSYSPPVINDDNTVTPGVARSETIQPGPQMTEKPSLLSEAWNWAKSPQGMLVLGTGLRSAGGEPDAGMDAVRIGAQMRAEQRQFAKDAQARADLARKNAAFKAAYRMGPDGKRRFDPAAYLDALSDGGDAAEGFQIAHDLAPKGGVSGDTAYSTDPLTGEVTWGDQRQPSFAEEQAAARAAEIERHNREMERIELLNHETSDYRAHKAPASRRGGASVPPLPPGFVVEK